MTREQKYKAFFDAIDEATKQNHRITFSRFGGELIISTDAAHYHAGDDRAFPVGATNWLNNLPRRIANDPG